MFVYVAGPYTKGDVSRNVHNAIVTGNNLRALGFTPFIPHLTHFWHMILEHDIDYWYRYDLEWLGKCDALFRIPGESYGADKEVERAKELGIPVFTSFEEIGKFARSHQKLAT